MRVVRFPCRETRRQARREADAAWPMVRDEEDHPTHVVSFGGAACSIPHHELLERSQMNRKSSRRHLDPRRVANGVVTGEGKFRANPLQ